MPNINLQFTHIIKTLKEERLNRVSTGENRLHASAFLPVLNGRYEKVNYGL